MTADLIRRGRPSLAQRLAARAMASAVDTRIPVDAAADALLTLARRQREPLERALVQVLRPGTDRSSPHATGAASVLRVALDRLDASAGETAVPPARP